MTSSFRLRLAPLLLAPLALATGCAKSSSSNVDWAHGPNQQIVGSPVGWLEAIKNNMAGNFSQISICVQTGNPKISDQALLTEVQLAYAAWLSNSGNYGASDWAHFKFVPQSTCSLSDTTYQGAVKLEQSVAQSTAESDGNVFNQPTITCQATGGGGGSCSGNGITLGLGGVGAASLGSQLTEYAPSQTRLSPYVDWISLRDDVTSNSKLDPATVQQITTAYDALVAKGTPAWSDLVAFEQLLTQAQLQNGADQGFGTQMQSLLSSGSSSTVNYRPEEAAMHVLLHEVGHQYGMEHADNPDPDSVTGNSGNLTQNASGQWVTSVSVMAYALPYAYLTADDVAGAAATGQAIRQVLGVSN